MTASLRRSSAETDPSTNPSFDQTRSHSTGSIEFIAVPESRSDGLSNRRNGSNYDQENNCRTSPEHSERQTRNTRSNTNLNESNSPSKPDVNDSTCEVSNY